MLFVVVVVLLVIVPWVVKIRGLKTIIIIIITVIIIINVRVTLTLDLLHTQLRRPVLFALLHQQ